MYRSYRNRLDLVVNDLRYKRQRFALQRRLLRKYRQRKLTLGLSVWE